MTFEYIVNSATTISGNLTVDTTTLVVDASNNRVGIGMNNPSVALDVNGTVMYNNGIIKMQYFSNAYINGSVTNGTLSTLLLSVGPSISFTPANTNGRQSMVVCQAFFRWSTFGSQEDFFEVYLSGSVTDSSNSLDYSRPYYVNASGGGGRETTRPLMGFQLTTTTTPLQFALWHKGSGSDASQIDSNQVKFLVYQIAI